MHDDSNICGISINLTPIYPTADIRRRCSPILWSGDNLNDSFVEIVTSICETTLSRIIDSRYTGELRWRVNTDVCGDRFIDDGEYCEMFTIEIDVFGDVTLLDVMRPILSDIVTAHDIGIDLRSGIMIYFDKISPDTDLAWDIEPSEYGE